MNPRLSLERELTRGYYTTYNEELEETLFIPGEKLDVPVVDENGEPLSFQATVETMDTIDGASGSLSSAIIEGIEVNEAFLVDGTATIHYTVNEETVSETDQIVFERALQLTALDFHADELHVMNETKNIKSVYSLLNLVRRGERMLLSKFKRIKKVDIAFML